MNSQPLRRRHYRLNHPSLWHGQRRKQAEAALVRVGLGFTSEEQA